MRSETPKTTMSTSQTLLARLSETVNRIDADDLSGLAQMHGWCEALAELGSQAPPEVDAGTVQSVTALARKLEELILGEAQDALAAFEQVKQAVAEVLGAVAPCAPCTPTAPVSTDAVPPAPLKDLSDDDVAEKLARVFDEGVEAPNEISNEDISSLKTAAPAEAPAGQTSAAPVSAEPAYEPVPLKLEVKELEFVKGFVEEAMEHVEAIEAAVLEVERSPKDAAKIDDLFRPFHTIKGMAGFLNLRDISSLTHEVETLLDQGRKGKRAITPGIIDLVLSVVDLLKLQIAGVGTWVSEPHSNPVHQPPVAHMIDRLGGVVSGRIDPNADAAGIAGSSNPKATTSTARAETADASSGPARKSDAAASAPNAGQQPPTASFAPAAPAKADATQASRSSEAAATNAAPVNPPKTLGEQSIRIDTEKLDMLIDMVGELVIAQTLVNMNGDVTGNPKLSKDVTQVTKIVRDVQELSMAMRMVPIAPTFQKMARLVRDVSRKAGKQVELTISGEDTELDKTVIQEIGDPLVHMVRNAIDHGIESPEQRRSAGKHETGAVHLHAGHEGGNIIIQISDDGKGLDANALIAKGIEKGIVQPGEELTEQQAFNLVFAPGFSTATQVTDISGRGVGMDVVKRNIDSLRGRVEITSEKGKGTTFTIRLPLTLAIIDGMVIRVGRERFIIPTIVIQQSLRPQRELITTVHHRGEVLSVRGELIPLIQLGELFGLTGRADPCTAMVVVVHCDGQLVGLVIEELIGQQQVVIKTLGEKFEELQGISGAAILGDGRVGLILEMSGLIAAHESFRRASICRASDTGTSDAADSKGPETTPDFAGSDDESDLAESQQAQLVLT